MRMIRTPEGYPDIVTDAKSQSVDYNYDLIGRLVEQRLPNMTQIEVTYDAYGSLTSLTPPGQPAHEFAYNNINLESEYQPPGLAGLSDVDTIYDYNLSQEISRITQPGGRTILFTYDAGGGWTKSQQQDPRAPGCMIMSTRPIPTTLKASVLQVGTLWRFHMTKTY